jgi:hypothetical protein
MIVNYMNSKQLHKVINPLDRRLLLGLYKSELSEIDLLEI